jgi:hypothetical protein
MVDNMEFDEMARIIEAEASVLDFQGKLAVGQCIADNRFDRNAFADPAESYSEDSMLAAELVVEAGARRFDNAKILQFRSFSKYGKDGGNEPDFGKIYGSGLMPDTYLYLGKDENGAWGHFYFGRYTKMAKPFKMLLIAGHGTNVDGSYDPGAIGCGYREAVLTRELVRLIKQRADVNNVPCDVAPDRNYYSYFKYGNTFDFTPYNYVLEVHFNASTVATPIRNNDIKGSMFYIDKRETGHSVEDAILNGLYSIGSRKAWDGVVITQRQWPEGLMVQNRVRAQGVSHAVLETCFISDGDDMAWYQAKKELIATKIIEGIITGFGLAKNQNSRYAYVGKGIATAEALEDMNVRDGGSINNRIVGLVRRGQWVEVLERRETGWLKVVWPGAECGYAYVSNVNGRYFKYV